MNAGKFVVLEGIEGVGKSTNIRFMSEFFKKHHLPIIITREPGGTPLAERIRDITLQKNDEPLSVDAELLLMFAARAQHLAQVIKPALMQGKWVLSDRFTDATYAYQGGGRGIAMDRIAILENLVQEGLRPDLTILLDLEPQAALARTMRRAHRDRFEEETLAFFTRVREVYLQRARLEPQRYRIVDAGQSLPAVQLELEKILTDYVEQST